MCVCVCVMAAEQDDEEGGEEEEKVVLGLCLEKMGENNQADCRPVCV